MRPVNSTRKSKWQATAGVIAVLDGVVCFPLLLPPFRKRKFCNEARRHTRDSDIGAADLSPHSSHTWFSIRQSRRGRIQRRKLFTIWIPTQNGRFRVRNGKHRRPHNREQYCRGGNDVKTFHDEPPPVELPRA